MEKSERGNNYTSHLRYAIGILTHGRSASDAAQLQRDPAWDPSAEGLHEPLSAVSAAASVEPRCAVVSTQTGH